MSLLIVCLLLGSLGQSMEIAFTGVRHAIRRRGLRLRGFSQIWTLPCYGISGFYFYFLGNIIFSHHFLIRMVIYAASIIIFELILGSIFKKILGVCPWEYKAGRHIYGYTRIDYFFYWMVGGYILEYFYRFLSPLVH